MTTIRSVRTGDVRLAHVTNCIVGAGVQSPVANELDRRERAAQNADLSIGHRLDAPERPAARADRSYGESHIMITRFASRLAAVAAVALIGATGVAGAQPFHHGPRGGGDFLMGFAGVKDQLSLNT